MTGAIYSTTSPVVKESVSSLFRTLAYREHSVLSLFIDTTQGGTAKSPDVKDANKHKWVDERLNSKRAKLNADIGAADTAIQVNNPYAQFIPGKSTLIIDDEVIAINAATKTPYGYTVTVTRGQAGTIAANHSTGAQIKFVDTWIEGEDFRSPVKNAGVFNENVCQIFRFEMSLSGSAEAAQYYDLSNNLREQFKQHLPAHFQEIENALLQPNAPVPNNTGDVNVKPRIAAGMPYYLNAGCKKDSMGNRLNMGNIQSDIDLLMNNGVDPNNLLMIAGSAAKSEINKHKELIVRENMKIRELDYNLNKLVLPNGNVTLAPYTLALKPNEYYLFEKDSVKVKFLRALALEKLAKTGDSTKNMVTTEATFEFHNWALGAAVRRSNIGG